ncbi:ATPase, T2SS/T4P/T4SS family, partial [Idiomarina sp. UBA1919]
MVDARLPDGSRVNAVLAPLATKGSCLTIRKFTKKSLTIEDLVDSGSLTKQAAEFLKLAVRCRQNIIVSGGTGTGKTTLLNILSQEIPEYESLDSTNNC